MKKVLSLLLASILCLTVITPAFAQGAENQVFFESYYTTEGNYIEKASFVENGEYAAVVKETFPDGKFNVQAINGDNIVDFGIIEPTNNYNTNPVLVPNATNEDYPIWTPYWYAGYDDYSQNGTAITAAVLAGILVAGCGMPASVAVTVGSLIYTALGSNIYDDLYFRTYRYYATMEEAPYAVTWYSKFVTYTYSDGAHKNLIAGPYTEVYTGPAPM